MTYTQRVQEALRDMHLLCISAYQIACKADIGSVKTLERRLREEGQNVSSMINRRRREIVDFNAGRSLSMFYHDLGFEGSTQARNWFKGEYGESYSEYCRKSVESFGARYN